MADNLMTEATQLYVQGLEEKLLFAESSLQTVERSLREKEQEVRTIKVELLNNQKAHACEIDEITSRHNDELKTQRTELQNNQKAHANEIYEIMSRHNDELKELRAEGEKGWTLANHMMRTLQKSKQLMKSREELVVAQAAKLNQVEKEVTEFKESVVKKVANLVLGIGKAANVTAGPMQMEHGNWKALEHCQEVLEQQSSSLNLLSTIASHGVQRNNSLRFNEDEEGHLVSATLCQCLPDLPDTPEPREVTLTLVKDEDSWSPHWSAWQFDDKCKTLILSNGTSIECGEGGSKARTRLKDLNMEVWEEEVEEVACQSCESFDDKH